MEERYEGKQPAKDLTYLSAVWMASSITEWQKEKLLEVCSSLKLRTFEHGGATHMTGAIGVNKDQVSIVEQKCLEEGIKILTQDDIRNTRQRLQ